MLTFVDMRVFEEMLQENYHHALGYSRLTQPRPAGLCTHSHSRPDHSPARTLMDLTLTGHV